jgi:hypothetical protein
MKDGFHQIGALVNRLCATGELSDCHALLSRREVGFRSRLREILHWYFHHLSVLLLALSSKHLDWASCILDGL